MTNNKIKILISGGGTGGHIFPAISIANQLKEMKPDCEFLFVGAEDRMEMERIPAAGYEIVGLPIMGFPRKPGIKIVTFIYKLAVSMLRAHRLIKQIKPDVVVGVGGYASGPILRAATNLNFPSLIQEQNSYAGITNRLLARKVDKICVAYENMDKYFPAEKIVYTGNPVRKDLLQGLSKKDEAMSFFKLDKNKPVMLVVGGSLGARTLNQSMLAGITLLKDSNVQVIWQTGKFYFDDVMEKTRDLEMPDIQITKFLSRMDLAYSVADLVVSRAGAGTISELCLMGKPTILVPSPNVAEDHQTKNALALVKRDAAILIKDEDAIHSLIPKALKVIVDGEKLENMARQIKKLAMPNAAEEIAKIVLELAYKK